MILRAFSSFVLTSTIIQFSLLWDYCRFCFIESSEIFLNYNKISKSSPFLELVKRTRQKRRTFFFTASDAGFCLLFRILFLILIRCSLIRINRFLPRFSTGFIWNEGKDDIIHLSGDTCKRAVTSDIWSFPSPINDNDNVMIRHKRRIRIPEGIVSILSLIQIILLFWNARLYQDSRHSFI